ncbi:unnamed protein product [Musa hybrid cultivar]
MYSSREEHLEAIYRILRHLKRTPNKALLFKKDNYMRSKTFTDVNWARSVSDRRPTSRYCTFIGDNLVTSRSKKHTVVTKSRAEAKLKAIAQGISASIIWTGIQHTSLSGYLDVPLEPYCDNKATINIAYNSVYYDITNHAKVYQHFIKEKIEEGIVFVSYIPIEKQLANILTKGLQKSSYEDLTSKLGMIDIFKSV